MSQEHIYDEIVIDDHFQEKGSAENGEESKRIYERWTYDQNCIYAQFLMKNKPFFSSEKKRRSCRVFKKLSQILQTKNVRQCKSHHQKMFKKYGSNSKIIAYFLGKCLKQDPKNEPLETRMPYEQKSESSNIQQKIESKQDLYFNEEEEKLFQVLSLNFDNKDFDFNDLI